MTDVSYVEKRLAELDALHSQEITDYGVMKSVLITELDIYRDLIPGYKIEPGRILAQTLQQKNVKAKGRSKEAPLLSLRKKEVLKVEKCEEKLVRSYEAYLLMLVRFCQKKHPESQALGSRCVGELCSFAHSFNFNELLLTTATECANSKLAAVAQPCLQALKNLFDLGEVNEAMLIVVDSLLKLVKEQHHAINPKILYIFLHLRIRSFDIHRDEPFRTKKGKHYKKAEKRVESKLQNVVHSQTAGSVKALQTRVLQKVMSVYLRVLDASHVCSELHQSLLLAPTLEGITKFAHLLNVELHTLLLQALRELVEDPRTSVTVGLHTLIAAASLAEHTTQTEGVARADLQQFHDALYRYLQQSLQLPVPQKVIPVNMEESGEDADDELTQDAEYQSRKSQGGRSGASTAFSIARSLAARRYVSLTPSAEWVHRARLMLLACEELLVKLKRLPTERVAAFVRMIALYTVTVPPHIALALVRLMQRLFTLNVSVTGLVLGGPDHDMGFGEFSLSAPSPDHANATSSFLWELQALKRSYHPTLKMMISKMQREYVKARKRYELLAQVPSLLESIQPADVLTKFDASRGGFQPLPQEPKKNEKTAKAQQKRKGLSEENTNTTEDHTGGIRTKKKKMTSTR